jgi:hypothetical protein
MMERSILNRINLPLIVAQPLASIYSLNADFDIMRDDNSTWSGVPLREDIFCATMGAPGTGGGNVTARAYMNRVVRFYMRLFRLAPTYQV